MAARRPTTEITPDRSAARLHPRRSASRPAGPPPAALAFEAPTARAAAPVPDAAPASAATQRRTTAPARAATQAPTRAPQRDAARTQAPTRAAAASTPAPDPDAGFADLGVPPSLIAALAARDITAPRPIQAATLPDSLSGRDVLGRGRTGSGKTYAFVLPVLARLAGSGTPRRPGRPRALILAPTRELVGQIEAVIAPLATALGLRTLTVFGGVGAVPQIKGLRAGVDVLVACPGRLADHIREGHARLDAVEVTVLDEADHMADLGFLPEVRRLMDQTPRDGQRLLFSATLDAGVDVLVKRFLDDPVTHSVDSALSPVAAMEHHVLHIRREDKLPVLVDLTAAPGRTLVFTRTKHGARTLARKLTAAGVPAVDLHGNLSQNARQRNLEAFSSGATTTLVATDIAARGIHVDDVALVIHADPPVEHKAYLHRSGRTARGDAAGTVVTLSSDEVADEVRDLTRRAGIRPTTTRLGPGHPLLERLAPGERALVAPAPPTAPPATQGGSRKPARGRSGAGDASRSRGGESARGQSGRPGAGRTRHGAGEPARSRRGGEPGAGEAAREGGRPGRRGGRGHGARRAAG